MLFSVWGYVPRVLRQVVSGEPYENKLLSRYVLDGRPLPGRLHLNALRKLELLIMPGQNVAQLCLQLSELATTLVTPTKLVRVVMLDDLGIGTPALRFNGFLIPLDTDTPAPVLVALLADALAAE